MIALTRMVVASLAAWQQHLPLAQCLAVLMDDFLTLM
jgi:hypothetical protein